MPWLIPLATAAYSIYSSASSASKAKKAERGLEESLKNTPQYRPNQSILNYYQQALNKYNVAPTETREFKVDQQRINQSSINALRGLQDRRSALAGIPALMAGKNNALLNAAIKADQRKEQELNRVGQAAQMKAGEEGKAFQQNEMYPFEAKYNLLAMKAAGNRADQRTSTQNAFNSLSSLGSLYEPNYSKIGMKQNLKTTYGNNWRSVFKDMQMRNYRNYFNGYNSGYNE